MAVTASGLFLLTWIDALDATQLALDLSLATHKIALFTDTVTPNFSSDTAYNVAPYNANETSGGSWPAGGVALTSPALTDESGSMTWDVADVNVATTTITNAMAGLIYADALAGDNAILLVDFVTAVSTSNGTFEIIWTAPASGGVFNIDMTP